MNSFNNKSNEPMKRTQQDHPSRRSGWWHIGHLIGVGAASFCILFVTGFAFALWGWVFMLGWDLWWAMLAWL